MTCLKRISRAEKEEKDKGCFSWKRGLRCSTDKNVGGETKSTG